MVSAKSLGQAEWSPNLGIFSKLWHHDLCLSRVHSSQQGELRLPFFILAAGTFSQGKYLGLEG